MRSIRAFAVTFALVLIASLALGAATGNLKLDVLGDKGAGAKNPAHLIGADGKEAGQVIAGATVAMPPGEYKLVMPIVGGQIVKDGIRIEAGRTHTLLIENVASLRVTVKDKTGAHPRFGVTVTRTGLLHANVASFLSGATYLFA